MSGCGLYLYVGADPLRTIDSLGLVYWNGSDCWDHAPPGQHPVNKLECLNTAVKAFFLGYNGSWGFVQPMAIFANIYLFRGLAEGGVFPKTRIALNNLQGRIGVGMAIAQLTAEGSTVLGSEITLYAGGEEAVADLLIENSEGELEFVEVKTGGSELSDGQEVVYPIVEQGGAVASGENAVAANLPVGVPLPPIPVRIIWIPPPYPGR